MVQTIGDETHFFGYSKKHQCKLKCYPNKMDWLEVLGLAHGQHTTFAFHWCLINHYILLT
jgi:hypothetical protein